MKTDTLDMKNLPYCLKAYDGILRDYGSIRKYLAEWDKRIKNCTPSYNSILAFNESASFNNKANIIANWEWDFLEIIRNIDLNINEKIESKGNLVEGGKKYLTSLKENFSKDEKLKQLDKIVEDMRSEMRSTYKECKKEKLGEDKFIEKICTKLKLSDKPERLDGNVKDALQGIFKGYEGKSKEVSSLRVVEFINLLLSCIPDVVYNFIIGGDKFKVAEDSTRIANIIKYSGNVNNLGK